MKLLIPLFSFLLIVGCGNDDGVLNEPPEVVDTRGVINDVVGGEPVVIFADSRKKLYAAFSRTTETSDEILEFQLSNKSFPTILMDQFGNNYTISGHSTTDSEVSLKSIEHVVGYWFFFPSFYKELQLFNGEEIFNNEYPTDLINEDFVFVGSFRDGIPSIDAPEFKSLKGREFIEDLFYSNLENDELVTVVVMDGANFIYPHRILEYHEVVNSIHEGLSQVLSYCPLTGTSKLWNSQINGKEVEFGVSGLLYNNNLVLYDRCSETYWSQILSVGIDGEHQGEKLEEAMVMEMTFQTAQLLEGANFYLSTNTGYNLDYSISIYESYKLDNRISFPLLNRNEKFHPKERLLGIPFGNKIKIYCFDDFITN